MACVREINRIEELAEYCSVWGALLAETPGASFFQSLEWLDAHWRHFGAGQKLRTLIFCADDDRPVGILPLVVRTEATRVGRLRVLTYPLHDWGSFYGPIGPHAAETICAGLEHVGRTRRDWDIVELRWLGAPGTDAAETEQAMRQSGFQAYRTLWNSTAIVDLGQPRADCTPLAPREDQPSRRSVTSTLEGMWEAYLATRPPAWRWNLRQCQRKLARRADVSLVHYRPRGAAEGDGDPRWDLYDACEQIARQSWQGSARNGTTLSHDSVRPFLRDVHAAAAAAGAVDLHLLLLGGNPAAFTYNYHYRGYVYGLRAGFDARQSRDGVGTLLWAGSLRDSFARGDRTFDLGVGSLECKRHFATGMADIWRCSHFHPTALRAQLLRAKRWAEERFSARRDAASPACTA